MISLVKAPPPFFKDISDADFGTLLELDFYYNRETEFLEFTCKEYDKPETCLILWNKLKQAYQATDMDNQEFSQSVDIKFYIDKFGQDYGVEGWTTGTRPYIIEALWSQLLYVYGYHPLGICNSLHRNWIIMQ